MAYSVHSTLVRKRVTDGTHFSSIDNVVFATVISDDIIVTRDEVSNYLIPLFADAPKLLLQYPLLMPLTKNVTQYNGEYFFEDAGGGMTMEDSEISGYYYYIPDKENEIRRPLIFNRGFITYPGELKFEGTSLPVEYDRLVIGKGLFDYSFMCRVATNGDEQAPFDSSAIFFIKTTSTNTPGDDSSIHTYYQTYQIYKKGETIFCEEVATYSGIKTFNELSNHVFFDVVTESKLSLIPDIIYKKYSYSEQTHEIHVIETSELGQVVDNISGKWSIIGASYNQVTISNGLLVIPPGTPSGSFVVKFTADDGRFATAEVYIQNDALTIDPYVNGGYTGITGGEGNFGIIDGMPEISDDVSNDIPTGSKEPDLGNVSIVSRYIMDADRLDQFGRWLWPNFLSWIKNSVFSVMYASPIESVISLMSYPFAVSALSGIEYEERQITWGNSKINASGLFVKKSFGSIDWGEIKLDEYWGNFLDYAPHTKIELYLPWNTGFVELNPNECMGRTLKIVTNVEIDKGTCLHNVISDDIVIATYPGVCGKQIPLTAIDTASKALALVTTAGAALVGGLAAGAASSAEIAGAKEFAATSGKNLFNTSPADYLKASSRAASAAAAPYNKLASRARNTALAGSIAAARSPARVSRNGSFSGTSAGLGVQYPYIIITRPDQSMPRAYGEHYGYPSNTYYKLGELKGYTEVGEIHLHGFAATESELSEIDSLLKEGVIF